MLIDTHNHINVMYKISTDSRSESVPSDAYVTNIIEEAEASDISIMLEVATSVDDSAICCELATRYAQIYASVGIHPTEVVDDLHTDIKKLERLILETGPKNVVAVGECGIDLYHDKVAIKDQISMFSAQIELALEHKLPIVVHSREAADETLNVLEKYKGENISGVMHCFSYGLDYAQEVYKLGFLLGIGGAVTYPKNNELRKVIETVPIESIILETDAPFLPPQPWRGKLNHPRNIKYIAEFIAQLRRENFSKIALETTRNGINLFRFDKD